MSTVNQKNVKVLLPRTGPDVFWQTIFEEFALEDDRKWRYLAMLALRENSGWPLELIAKLFKHKTGHVTRCLDRIKEELREVFLTAERKAEERIEDREWKMEETNP